MECWSFPPRYDDAYTPPPDQPHWFPERETMDPAERDFTMAGEARYTDPESELSVPAGAAVRAAYDRTVGTVIDEWRTALGAMGARYELVLTDQPYAGPLRRAFDARQRRP